MEFHSSALSDASFLLKQSPFAYVAHKRGHHQLDITTTLRSFVKLKTIKKTKRVIPQQSDGYVKMKCNSWKPQSTDNRDTLMSQRPDPDVKHQFLEPQECRAVTFGSSQFLVSRSWKHGCCTADLTVPSLLMFPPRTTKPSWNWAGESATRVTHPSARLCSLGKVDSSSVCSICS